jgi:hypothetical protein
LPLADFDSLRLLIKRLLAVAGCVVEGGGAVSREQLAHFQRFEGKSPGRFEGSLPYH